jgi:hypothetical protein
LFRNLSSFFQAGNVEPLKPSPSRTACFLAQLAALRDGRRAARASDGGLAGLGG